MSLLKRLFGGGDAPEADPEVYQDFRIYPTPVREGSDYRIAGRIEKEVGGETKTHTFTRADTISGLEAAQEATVFKAKQLIDQIGDHVFDQSG